MKIAAAGELHGRSVIEWVGKSSDERPPEKVRLRVLLRYGRRCHWSGVLIRPGDEWDCDHVKAIINGGENREKNLAPIWRGKAHHEKTALDREEADRVKSLQKKHYGIKKPKPQSRYIRKVSGEVVLRMGQALRLEGKVHERGQQDRPHNQLQPLLRRLQDRCEDARGLGT